MSNFRLDIDGDLDVTNNNLSLTTGADAVKQHMQCRFRTFLGEWFLDTTMGVPWFQDILKKQVSFQPVQSLLKATAVDTPGVIDLEKFEFDYNSSNREFRLDLRANTTDGPIDFSQVVEI